jgi:hypothetical protein
MSTLRWNLVLAGIAHCLRAYLCRISPNLPSHWWHRFTSGFPFGRGADSRDSRIDGLWWLQVIKLWWLQVINRCSNRITSPLGASYPDSE